MSPSVRRWRTKRALDRAIAKHGKYHPATFAAYARATIAWAGVIKAPALPELSRTFGFAERAALNEAYCEAFARASKETTNG